MNRELNVKLIFKVLGSLIIVESLFLIVPVAVAIFYREFSIVHNFFFTTLIGLVFGGFGLLIGRKAKLTVGKREGAIMVSATWVLYTLLGSLPFYFSGVIPNFTNAFFETLSGFTTTGTTILNNIESLPYSMLFWRSMTHWIGGLGIIVIFLALLPMIGGAGYQLFTSEGTTPMREKILPKVNETAKILLFAYLTLTLLCTIALFVAGMGWFDAINHALSIVSTGGFSTKQLSIAYFNSPAIEYVTIFFMFFSGINFTLYYYFVNFKFKKLSKNEELKYYVILLVVSTLIVFSSHINLNSKPSFVEYEESFRNSLFIVTSCITSTGLCTEDYTLWNPFTWVVLLVLMITGASTYSTSGGLKIARVVLLSKFCYYEFKKLLHPNAIMPVKFNGQIVKDDVMLRILGFAIIYIMIIIFGSFILSVTGLGFSESLSGMITSMSDVGLGLGKLGPSHSFSEIPVFSKWFLAFIMIVGRLEIYSVLLLLTPVFWRK